MPTYTMTVHFLRMAEIGSFLIRPGYYLMRKESREIWYCVPTDERMETTAFARSLSSARNQAWWIH